MILQFLKYYLPPEYKDLQNQVEDKGGREVVMRSNATLRELLKSQPRTQVSRGNNLIVLRAHHVLNELRGELQGPGHSIETNLPAFERKFDMQQRQIVSEVDMIVHREGDRIITSITSGPHNRVIDEVRNVSTTEICCSDTLLA